MSQNNCLQVQNKYKNDMGSFSYYWAELLSTVKHDRFYLHGRCWLYQMEYQNIWLFCIFYSDQHTCRHGRGKKEKKKKKIPHMDDMSETNGQKRAVGHVHVYVHKPKGF